MGRKAKVQGGVGLVGRVQGGRWSRLGRKLGWKMKEVGRRCSVKGEVGWEKELGRRKIGCE